MKLLVVMGTRPEAIKFAPLIKAFQAEESITLKVCVTGQHKEMLQQVTDFFEIVPDYDLQLMKPNQTLFDISAGALLGLKDILDEFQPEIVFVQGDTTTAFIGGLAAFYTRCKVAHLEAGLRSGNKYSPFPEEANRKLIGVVADYHFPPTERARLALERESISENTPVVGNTVVDALLLGLDLLEKKQINFSNEFNQLDPSKRTILVTAHRRESFGKPMENICQAILEIAREFDDVEFLYPVHYNPNVRETVMKLLSNQPSIHLIDPVDYPRLIWLMNKATIVLTDSGGIQEEAPSLGKPVLVMRDVTERVEGVEAGTAELVGTDQIIIQDKLRALLTNEQGVYDRMAKAVNPYGDGSTSQQIVTWLRKNHV